MELRLRATLARQSSPPEQRGVLEMGGQEADVHTNELNAIPADSISCVYLN